MTKKKISISHCVVILAFVSITVVCGSTGLQQRTMHIAAKNDTSRDYLHLSTFSQLEKYCVWSKKNISTKQREDIGKFPSPCVGLKVAWRKDLRKALIFFDSGLARSLLSKIKSKLAKKNDSASLNYEQISNDLMWVVDLKNKTKRKVALPARWDVEELGFTKKGEPLILVSWNELGTEIESENAIIFEGKKIEYAGAGAGVPTVVRAYILHNFHNWQVEETKISDSGACGALGVAALKYYQEIKGDYRTSELLKPHIQYHEIESKEILSRLQDKVEKACHATNDDWEWGKVNVGSLGFYALFEIHEYAFLTGVIFPSVDDELAYLDKHVFNCKDNIAVMAKGDYTLFVDAYSGSRPRMYNQKTRAISYWSDEEYGVTFWP